MIHNSTPILVCGNCTHYRWDPPFTDKDSLASSKESFPRCTQPIMAPYVGDYRLLSSTKACEFFHPKHSEKIISSAETEVYTGKGLFLGITLGTIIWTIIIWIIL